jgi:hypothetical protein
MYKKSELSGDVCGHVMWIVIEGIVWSAEHLEYVEYLTATQNKLQFGILILYCALKVIVVILCFKEVCHSCHKNDCESAYYVLIFLI